MTITTIADYVTANGITVDVTHDRGMQVDSDRWEHHAYVLTLHYGPRTLVTDWRQGTGIDSSPSDDVATVFDSLVSDAQVLEECDSFDEFADTFGYDHDSLRAFRTWETLQTMGPAVIAFIGSRDEFERVAVLERM